MRPVLVFTIHKAASMFLHKLIREICYELSVEHISINYMQHYNLIDRMHYRRYFKPIKQKGWKEFIETRSLSGCNMCFGPIRIVNGEPSVPDNLAAYSIIVQIRDPRDALTSLFFSYAYSHPNVKGYFTPDRADRVKWIAEGIDEFVLSHMHAYKARYNLICDTFLGLKNVKILKYEDMVMNYGEWLQDFMSAYAHIRPPSRRFMGLGIKLNSSDRIYSKLYGRHKNEFSITHENMKSHKRQVKPGDYARKLKADTRQVLTGEFKDILVKLDYSKDHDRL